MTANHPSSERILASQTSLVTGSSSGIGAGIAGELGRAGARPSAKLSSSVRAMISSPGPGHVNYTASKGGVSH